MRTCWRLVACILLLVALVSAPAGAERGQQELAIETDESTGEQTVSAARISPKTRAFFDTPDVDLHLTLGARREHADAPWVPELRVFRARHRVEGESPDSIGLLVDREQHEVACEVEAELTALGFLERFVCPLPPGWLEELATVRSMTLTIEAGSEEPSELKWSAKHRKKTRKGAALLAGWIQ